jgi:hypothetical protein
MWWCISAEKSEELNSWDDPVSTPFWSGGVITPLNF